ncbi:hypothetical protein SRRS_52360 [Sporomusa rhizae]|uniref:hypothetical protein n=1 Tax=Sporomusa rhizae TaxID=357999 RepID=UPI00352BA628
MESIEWQLEHDRDKSQNLWGTKRKVEWHAESAPNQQLVMQIESALYDYPMWKVNLSQIQFQNESQECKHGSMEERSVVRCEFAVMVKLVDNALSSLSPVQHRFVTLRYFSRKPFKNIAEELAMTERHLYRIRQEVIRLFGIAFGWQ